MILYHGTNAEFDIIDLAKSNRFKDFGQGFYLTDIRQQAAESTILSLDFHHSALSSCHNGRHHQ